MKNGFGSMQKSREFVLQTRPSIQYISNEFISKSNLISRIMEKDSTPITSVPITSKIQIEKETQVCNQEEVKAEQKTEKSKNKILKGLAYFGVGASLLTGLAMASSEIAQATVLVGIVVSAINSVVDNFTSNAVKKVKDSFLIGVGIGCLADSLATGIIFGIATGINSIVHLKNKNQINATEDDKTSEKSKNEGIRNIYSFITGATLGFGIAYSFINNVYLGAQITYSAIFGISAVAANYVGFEKFNKGFAKGAIMGGLVTGAVTGFAPAFTASAAIMGGVINGVIEQINKKKKEY